VNTEQRADILAACEAGDSVRVVTLALAIAATHARAGDTDKAIGIRRQVDDYHTREERERERRRMLDQAALAAITGLLANPNRKGSPEAFAKDAYGIADAVLAMREIKP